MTEQEKLMNEILEKFDSKIKEATKNKMDVSDYEAFKSEIKKSIADAGFDTLKAENKVQAEKINEIHQKHGELVNTIAKQNEVILKLTTAPVDNSKKVAFNSLSKKEKLGFLLTKAMESSEFKSWKDTNFKGAMPKFDLDRLKATTGIATDHTGTILISEADSFVQDIPRAMVHMRNHITARPTEEVNITFGAIGYDDVYNLGTQMLSENEAITDVNFETSEVTSNVKRLGVSMPVSRRYFKGKPLEFINHILDILPDALGYKEDTQILFGDGSGDNLAGILKDARKFDLTPKTYSAGNIDSVATWDSGAKALITFENAHGLRNGDKLTIANATASSYNATHTDIIVKDAKNIIINLTYVAEANTSAWTGSGASYWYKSVESAQELDVLLAAKSVLDAGFYTANKLFVNPQSLAKSKSLKGTDNHYINYQAVADLIGVDIVPMERIPAGWFLIGDFSSKSIEIRDYSQMSIQLLEDVTTKKGNYIVVLADAEFHLVKKNPQWYIFDRFETAKAELETA